MIICIIILFTVYIDKTISYYMSYYIITGINQFMYKYNYFPLLMHIIDNIVFKRFLTVF